jgi:hypothetical protein
MFSVLQGCYFHDSMEREVEFCVILSSAFVYANYDIHVNVRCEIRKNCGNHSLAVWDA